MLALAARRPLALAQGQGERPAPMPDRAERPPSPDLMRREQGIGPLPRAPEPPALDEPAVRRVPAEPRAPLDRAQAERLLALAKQARAGVQRAVAQGGAPGASPADRAAAERAKGCMADLVARMPDLDRAIATLEAAAAPAPMPGWPPPSLDLGEIQAIEAFGRCAGQLPAEPKPDLLRAAAGVGIPAALSILLSLLRP